MNIEYFLEEIRSKLPDACTITRLRAQGHCPPFFSIKPNFYYLRSDVISWLQERYKNQEVKPPVKPIRHKMARLKNHDD